MTAEAVENHSNGMNKVAPRACERDAGENATNGSIKRVSRTSRVRAGCWDDRSFELSSFFCRTSRVRAGCSIQT